MYDLERIVWVKDQQFVGRITERNWVGKPRHATYVVESVQRVWVPMVGWVWERTGYDYMCGSQNLRAADYQCESCNRWLPISTASGNPYSYVCFLCDLAERGGSIWSRDIGVPKGWHPVAIPVVSGAPTPVTPGIAAYRQEMGADG